MTGLQELYTDRGLLSGASSGLKEGADLGHMFAQTGEINQRTLRDKQMLPIELAKADAELDQTLMANDLTRAVQTPEYLQAHGENELAKTKITKEQLAHAAKILPFEQFIDFQNKASQAQVQQLQGISTALRSGNIDQVYSQLAPKMTNSKQKAELDAVYKEAKSSPQGMQKVLSQLDQTIFQITNTMNQANLPQQQERYLKLLEFMWHKYAEDHAKVSGLHDKNKNIENRLVELSDELARTSDPAKRKVLIDQYNYLKESKYVKETKENFGNISSEKRVGPPLTPIEQNKNRPKGLPAGAEYIP